MVVLARKRLNRRCVRHRNQIEAMVGRYGVAMKKLAAGHALARPGEAYVDQTNSAIYDFYVDLRETNRRAQTTEGLWE